MVTTTRIRRSPSRMPPPPECPLEECLELLGSRWTPKILWYLRVGPRRFGDLKRDLGTVSTKVLTQRLKKLEKNGLITRTVITTRPKTVEYALTPSGEKLSPLLDSMAEAAKVLRKG